MSNLPVLEYWQTKARVYEILESAHWYLVFTAKDDNSRYEAAALIARTKRELETELLEMSIAKYKNVNNYTMP